MFSTDQITRFIAEANNLLEGRAWNPASQADSYLSGREAGIFITAAPGEFDGHFNVRVAITPVEFAPQELEGCQVELRPTGAPGQSFHQSLNRRSQALFPGLAGGTYQLKLLDRAADSAPETQAEEQPAPPLLLFKPRSVRLAAATRLAANDLQAEPSSQHFSAAGGLLEIEIQENASTITLDFIAPLDRQGWLVRLDYLEQPESPRTLFACLSPRLWGNREYSAASLELPRLYAIEIQSGFNLLSLAELPAELALAATEISPAETIIYRSIGLATSRRSREAWRHLSSGPGRELELRWRSAIASGLELAPGWLAVEQALGRLESAERETRRAALTELTRFKDQNPLVGPALQKLAHTDPDPELRLAARSLLIEPGN